MTLNVEGWMLTLMGVVILLEQAQIAELSYRLKKAQRDPR